MFRLISATKRSTIDTYGGDLAYFIALVNFTLQVHWLFVSLAIVKD